MSAMPDFSNCRGTQMSAVMRDELPSHDRSELCGRGHELMQSWGLHRRGGERSRSDVASGSWSEPLDKTYEDEPDHIVAIDRILAGLHRGGFGDSVEIAKRFYLEYPKYDYWQVAQKVYKTDGFVRLTIKGICALVEQRIVE